MHVSGMTSQRSRAAASRRAARVVPGSTDPREHPLSTPSTPLVGPDPRALGSSEQPPGEPAGPAGGGRCRRRASSAELFRCSARPPVGGAAALSRRAPESTAKKAFDFNSTVGSRRLSTLVNHSAHNISNISPNIRRLFPVDRLPLAGRQSTPGRVPRVAWEPLGLTRADPSTDGSRRWEEPLAADCLGDYDIYCLGDYDIYCLGDYDMYRKQMNELPHRKK
eukprot:937231-Prorocentrum_minimum.AAC.3